VAELADAQDLKSWVPQGACGFKTRPRQSLDSGAAPSIKVGPQDAHQASAQRDFRSLNQIWAASRRPTEPCIRIDFFYLHQAVALTVHKRAIEAEYVCPYSERELTDAGCGFFDEPDDTSIYDLDTGQNG
jgi:hypothetical protein